MRRWEAGDSPGREDWKASLQQGLKSGQELKVAPSGGQQDTPTDGITGARESWDGRDAGDRETGSKLGQLESKEKQNGSRQGEGAGRPVRAIP